MDNFLQLLQYPLDKYQENALKTQTNSVIAAGAGSGKTQVLATRFAWLIMTEQAKADEILTLTFTNKAAAEMYQRIYETLSFFANQIPSEYITQNQINLAKQALEDFSTVHIQTLDSYCSSIVHQCANRYGIKPDFSVGSPDCERNIKNEAFIYIIKNSSNLAIQTYVKPGQLQTFSENVFSKIILKYTSLATEPHYFENKFNYQLDKIVNLWNSQIIGKNENSIFSYVSVINEAYRNYDKKTNENQINYITNIVKIIDFSYKITELNKLSISDIVNKSELLNDSIVLVNNFINLVESLPGKKGVIQDISKTVKLLKEKLNYFESILNFLNQYAPIKAFNILLDDFLTQINISKRVSGNLSFVDISELALKVLLENEDIRNQEKNAYKKIMIDEFQDNNSSNRDLLYILSLKKGEFENNGKCIISVDKDKSLHDLLKDKRSPNKLFFVGDEKQSIYKFRGADVSVFNELTKNNENTLIPMTINYRSTNELVKAFNVIFKNGNGIFDSYSTPEEKIDYEAYYDKDAEKKNEELPELTSKNCPIHALVLYKPEVDTENKNHIPENEQLCYSIAKKIYEMGNESKNWNSFAILDRKRTDRHLITKYLSLFGIPYIVDQQKNIFSDGVINDFYNYLRICVYPSDINAFAAYLCSPFCGLSENSVEIILSYLNYEKSNDYDYVFNPLLDISNELKQDLSENQFKKYENAIKFYKDTKELVLKQKLTTTLSSLWHNKGYKYETFLTEQTTLCEEHFDMLFELARQSEEQGKTVSWFIDQLDLLKTSSANEDSDIDAGNISYPIERSAAVQIMTIHKSKGLQFEHVFLYGCTSVDNKSDGNLYFFDEENGVSIKPEQGKENYFVIVQKEIAKQKELAEFRRIIYVGITRAIKNVYIVGKYSVVKESSSICRLFENMFTINYPYNSEDNYTFMPTAGFDYIPIKPVSYSEIYHNLSHENSIDLIREKILLNSSETVRNAQEIKYECNPVPRKTPSSLETNYTENDAEDSDSGEKYEYSEDILRKSEFTASDFGTLVHSYLEMQANGININEYEPESKLLKNLNSTEIEKYKNICIKMCNDFSNSEKGIEFSYAKTNNLFYRAEWGFRMFDEGTIFTGSIDLIYQNKDGSYTIVDYKSDNQIVCEKYIEQQKCYRKAAAKMLKISENEISLFLYFLKHNKLIKI